MPDLIDSEKLSRLLASRTISQTALAQRAGISRATVSRLLAAKRCAVRAGTESRLARALGLRPGELISGNVQADYSRAIEELTDELDFTGLGVLSLRARMPFDRGYVDVSVRITPKPTAARADCGPAPGRKPNTRPGRDLSLLDAIDRSQRLYVLGDPGAGKTTALRRIARTLIAQQGSEARHTPVLVRLSDWAEQLRADRGVDPISAAAVVLPEARRAETVEWLRTEAAAGRIVLLLDGLDEVADPDLQAPVVDGLREFIAEHPDACVVISSRMVDFEAPPLGVRFDSYLLQPLGNEDVKQFLNQWVSFRYDHEHMSAQMSRAKELYDAIVSNARVRGLAENPMMLTILALLHEAGAALPQRKWSLYEKLAEAFLFHWEQSKRNAGFVAPDHPLSMDDREVVSFLDALADSMQRQDRTLVPRWWLASFCQSYLRNDLGFAEDVAPAEADALLWSLQHRSGLLVERGPERFGFRHLAFQEFFAARRILRTADPVSEIQPYVYHPRWHEIVSLVCSQLDRQRGLPLIRLILDDPDPAGRFLRRGLLAILGCIADGLTIRDQRILESLREQIRDLGKTRWLGLSLEAIWRLAQIEQRSPSEFSRRAIDSLLAEAKSSLSRDEYELLLVECYRLDLIKGERRPSRAPGLGPIAEETWLVNGEELTFVHVDAQKERGAAWVDTILAQVKDDPNPSIKAACALELKKYMRREKVRTALISIFESDTDENLRELLVDEVFARVAESADVRELLLRGMRMEPNARIRASCTCALEQDAVRNPGLRSELMNLIATPDVAPAVRNAAVRALSMCVRDSAEVRNCLLTTLRDVTENEDVRCAALWAIQTVLISTPDGIEQIVSLLSHSRHSCLATAAAQILAQCAGQGRVEWAKLPIEQIEHMLLTVEQPCRHRLDAVRTLVEAREVRRLGVSLAQRVASALAACRERVCAGFIFGSCARNEQSADSDIDLLLIGDITLREMSPELKRLEQDVGRQVNVVIYSREEFDQRVHSNDPFLTEVMKGKKLFVLGAQDELRAVAQ